MKKILTLGCVLWTQLSAMAACPTDAQIQHFLQDFAKRQTSVGFERGMGWEDARCARQKLAAKLPAYLGQHIGYTLRLSPGQTNNPSTDTPLAWGHMYDRNLVDIIAVLPAQYGAQPRVQAAWLFEVKDAGLADAASALEALAHIESMVPFIELSDDMVEGELAPADALALNVGFRGGVLGAEIHLSPQPQTVDAMAQVHMEMRDLTSGQVLGVATAKHLAGQPLIAAMAFAKALKKEGVLLKKGDLLNLSGFMPAFVPIPGQRIELKYVGMPGDPAVTVEFN